MPQSPFNELLDAARHRAQHYLDGVAQRPVAATAEAIARLRGFEVPLPERGRDPLAVLRELDELGSPATTATMGPRYFGYVIGGSVPASLAAHWLASAWDQCPTFHDLSPTVVTLERVALGWLLEAMDLPREAAGAFVSGATFANFTAMAAARQALLARQGWDAAAQGLFGAPPIRVVVGGHVHSTVLKSLSLLGLGRERVVRAPADREGRIIPEQLPALDAQTLLCLQAGVVETGAFDPFLPLIETARAAGAWVHVDGAFGLWAQASPEHRALSRGVEAADSWAVDMHKWLNVPYDSAAVFTRDAGALRAAMALGPASYLSGAVAERQPGHYSPELSRRARAVDTWAALASLGRHGVAELVARCCRLARRAAESLAANGWEIVNEVVLNQVLVRFGDDESTRRAIAAIQQDGTCWAGGASWQGRAVMRISVSNYTTGEADIDTSVAAMDRCARAVGAHSQSPRAQGVTA